MTFSSGVGGRDSRTKLIGRAIFEVEFGPKFW